MSVSDLSGLVGLTWKVTETDFKIFCGVQNPSKANPSKEEPEEPTKKEESELTKMSDSDSDQSALIDSTWVGLTSRMSGVAEHKSKTLLSAVRVPPEQKQNVKYCWSDMNSEVQTNIPALKFNEQSSIM